MRPKLRIAILESQAPEDFTRPIAGKSINDMLALCEFSSSFQIVVARSGLAAGMISLRDRASQPDLVPLLHLILPDRPNRFSLTSRETITWAGLAAALNRLDQSLGGRLHISAAGPEAYRSLRAAFAASGTTPPSMIGPAVEATSRQSALAVALFAHALADGKRPSEIIEAVSQAIGLPFQCIERDPAKAPVPASDLRADELAGLLV